LIIKKNIICYNKNYFKSVYKLYYFMYRLIIGMKIKIIII